MARELRWLLEDVVSVYESDPWVDAAISLRITRLREPIEEIIARCEAEGEKCESYVQRISSGPRDEVSEGVKKGFGHRMGAELKTPRILILKPTRLEALALWDRVNTFSGIRLSGLERSLRIQRPPFPTIDKESKEQQDEALPVYEELINRGVPEEDARYLLPEGVITTVIFDAADNQLRYLAKLGNSYFEKPGWEELERLQGICKGIRRLVKEELGYIPKEEGLGTWELYGSFEDWKERVGFGEEDEQPKSKNLFSWVLNLDVDGSLSMYAQAVRERQALVELEPLESIARRATYVIPKTFDDEAKKEYKRIAKLATEIQINKLENEDPTFAYNLLLGQKARARFHMLAAHAPYMIAKRGCGAAQWEIRERIAFPAYEKLRSLGIEVGPRCVTFRECWESPKVRCPIRHEWPKLTNEEIIERLRTRDIEDLVIVI